MVTVYTNEKDALLLTRKLNAIHRRYEFIYEAKDGNYFIYCLADKNDSDRVRKELLVFLLDRMTYGLTS